MRAPKLTGDKSFYAGNVSTLHAMAWLYGLRTFNCAVNVMVELEQEVPQLRLILQHFFDSARPQQKKPLFWRPVRVRSLPQ